MNRRSLLLSALAAPLATSVALPVLAQERPPMRTVWRVNGSEGQDAIAFLAPLSGRELYTRFYAEDVALFAPRLSDEIRSAVPALWDQTDGDGLGLLSPKLALILSHAASDATIDDLLAALDNPESAIRPAYQAGIYWDEANWTWLVREAPRLRSIFAGLKDAGFPGFLKERSGTMLEDGLKRLRGGLPFYDLIRVEEKLTGRTFQPEIDITLLQFVKPHGIKVQGQRFLQSLDYDVATTVRIAAHELIHPPIPMEGPTALAALAVLEKDPLIPRIVSEHDPRWGYTTLSGMLNEDLCQALDQLISEMFGVARNPADRWRMSDDGIHVIAAGLYGLLRQDRWNRTGGSIEAWLADAVQRGRLDPANFHAVAADVLERPVDRLWPLTPES